MKTNPELIQDYIRGDNNGLAELFEHRGYYEICYFKAYHYLKPDRHSAEDVVQDVVFTMLNYTVRERTVRFEGKPEATFVNYLLTVTQNKAIDRFRKSGREAPLIPGGYQEPRVEPREPQPGIEDVKTMVRSCARRKYAENPDWNQNDLVVLDCFLEAGPGDLVTVEEQTGLSREELRTIKTRLKRRLSDCSNVGPFMNLII